MAMPTATFTSPFARVQHKPPLYEPSPAEIREAKEAIRQTWLSPTYVDGERIIRKLQPLKAKQKRLLLFYHSFVDQHGRQPSILEVRDSLSLPDINRVFRMLESLRARGALPRVNKPR